MSRSFFSRSSNSRDTSPLLPQHRNSLSLDDLSPRPSVSISHSQATSPSPPPSFYRDNNVLRNESPALAPNPSLSPSPSRTKAKQIQFAAPPPPIAPSVLLSPTNGNQLGSGRAETRSANHPRTRRGSGSSIVDPLIVLERREKAIEGDLQALLDAQSAGLVHGFGGNGDGHSDAGSSTPTTRSVQGRASGGIVPVRQPKRKVVGLRGARRGLLRCMGELVGIKREEMGILMVEIGRREELLGKVGQWETRIEGVRSQLSERERAGEDNIEIADLRTEERALDSEIRDLEDRLAQMKARKRWLGERINESVNKREARLSSYRGALREVESEVKEFLKRPPISVSVIMGDEAGLFALPVGRRTLGMAKEWWNKEVSQLQLRRQEVEREKTALEEGTQMWQECISTVVAFEDDLRQAMASNEPQDPEMLRVQVGKMGTVISKLQETLEVVEARNWKLLICAIGAELEAFREGESILKTALEIVQGDTEEHHDDQSQHSSSANELLEELNGALNREQIKRQDSEEREESEDDGPNLAELLVDRGDHDTS